MILFWIDVFFKKILTLYKKGDIVTTKGAMKMLKIKERN